MKVAALSSCLMVACLPVAAQAAPFVYPGCAVPSLKAGHHTFYVDPVRGSPSGDGSSAKPWRTLAEVLNLPSRLVATQGHKVRGGTDPLVDVNASGPIKAGDVIMLMNGNHGDVFVQGAFNKDFITVMAAPGQTPILQSLKVQSSQKWLFQGLKVVPGLATVNSVGIASLAYGDWVGATNNIILDNSLVATVESTSGWTTADWLSKPKQTGVLFGASATCMSLSNSHIMNVVNGVGLNSSQTLVQANTIEQMLNDGIDVDASNVTIQGNTIKNGANVPGNALHADGIQGWSPTVNGVVQTVNNVIIDGNTLNRTGDGSKNYMQGISIFDGKWNNLSVINNSVAVNTWNGIVLSAPTNSKVINNTVFGTDTNYRTRLSIAAGKDKSLPQNTIVRNNIAPEIYVVGNAMAVDHNMSEGPITLLGNSVTSGVVGNDNAVKPSLSTGFANINRAANIFDLRLRAGSVAVAAGDAAMAPKVDINGKTRTMPVDNGAYNH